ncbi:rod shape-determining protein RodA [candidate division WOR-3 bacterium JGI_Cruoil_03_44_89]|uniref:Rod shape-determining protein RodA n=1 Tax=candidate division WOR-3 bacterium JGI_Cruoil_03_44_89 TaxID=1973748 RepID=A0A235BQ74_UNCW3|nr:MAG: rod shape-determining protein RodA [candidate division WOR-3 bacterium JGI_Cruoil_03_44_89]
MRFFKDFDFIFLAFVLLVVVLGLLTLYSASYEEGGGAFKRQVVWVAIGLVVLLLFSHIPFRFWQSVAPVLYVISLILLMVVLFAGRGVKRWISLGPISFQPSEFAKVSTVLFMSDVLSIRRFELKHLRSFLVPFLICLPPFMLVFVEPDLGTSLVFIFMFFALTFYKGTRPIYIFFLISPFFSLLTAFHWGIWVVWLILVLSVIYWGRIPLNEGIFVFIANVTVGLLNPLVWQAVLPYQRARLTGFLSPESNPAGMGWQLLQSKIAIGSGRIFGKGFLEGTQKGLAFLPQKHTDFAFSSFAEEFGFIGNILLFSAFIFIVLRGIRIARASRNQFASLFAFGLVSIILFQVIINVGMTMGLFPVVGIPLPLLSYGGSSTLVFLGIAGLILGIGKQRYQY